MTNHDVSFFISISRVIDLKSNYISFHCICHKRSLRYVESNLEENYTIRKLRVEIREEFGDPSGINTRAIANWHVVSCSCTTFLFFSLSLSFFELCSCTTCNTERSNGY